MRSSIVLLLLVLLGTTIPPLTGRVVDEASLLTPNQRAELERKLEEIERSTSIQIVIVTIPSLDGEPIEDYSIRLAQQWRIGQKGLENGVVILVAKAERKVRIEVGYGLESVIPDGMAGRIIREQITPRFRQNDYYGGLNAAVDALVLAARKQYPATSPASPKTAPETPRVENLIFPILIAGILWFSIASAFAGAGCIVPYLISGLSAAVLFPFALLMSGWTSLLNFWLPLGGFFFGVLMTPILRSMKNERGSDRWKRRTWTTPSYRRAGRGGGFGGGWGGGGGGFSGGGGRFGGGGASGGW